MDDFEVLVDQGPTLLEFIGRFHPLAVHLPIATTALLLLYEAAAARNIKGFDAAMPWHVALTLVSYVPAVLTGLLRIQEYGDSEAIAQATNHGTLMTLALTVLGIFGAIRAFTGRATWWYLAALVLALGIMGAGAHLGGLMVYGADYFG